MATEAAMGDPPHSWTPIFSPPNWPSYLQPNFYPPEALPPNHDMSPAPAERYVSTDYEAFDVDLEKCPHCGKPLSE